MKTASLKVKKRFVLDFVFSKVFDVLEMQHLNALWFYGTLFLIKIISQPQGLNSRKLTRMYKKCIGIHPFHGLKKKKNIYIRKPKVKGYGMN